MLLQSHEGFIRLLPALPGAWPNGHIKGLRARGGFDVAIRWKNGALDGADIHSRLGHPCRVKSHQPIAVVDELGRDVPMREELPGLYSFGTEADRTYHVGTRPAARS